MTWRARACAVAGAIACAGIAAPGGASAVDPAGLEGLARQVQAAVFLELAAAVPQPAAASSRGGAQDSADIAQATAEGISAQALGPTAPTALAANSAPPTADAIFPGSPPGAASASVVLAPLAGATRAPSQTAGLGVVHTVPGSPGPREQSTRVSSRGAVFRTHVLLVVRATGRSNTTTSYAAAIVRQRVQAGSGTSARARSPGADPRERRPTDAPSRQPQPPGPVPQGPGMSSAGQAGGQGVLLPLMVAALAAALAILGFELLPRVLPLPAFRKPRRIVLPPWHPG